MSNILSWSDLENNKPVLVSETASASHYYQVFQKKQSGEFFGHILNKNNIGGVSGFLCQDQDGFNSLDSAKAWLQAMHDNHIKNQPISKTLGCVFELYYQSGDHKELITKDFREKELRDFIQEVALYDKRYHKDLEQESYEKNHPLAKWRVVITGGHKLTGDILNTLKDATWASYLNTQLNPFHLVDDANNDIKIRGFDLAEALANLGDEAKSAAIDINGQAYAFSCPKDDLIKLNAIWGIGKGVKNPKTWSLGYGYNPENWDKSAINK